MAAIYLHIPFCKRLCGYCDFFKSVKLQALDSVVDAIAFELLEQRDYLGGEPIRTIYFGGGTPSLLSAARIEELLGVIAQNYNLDELEEVTLEANPDDLNYDYLVALRRAGVNRLSIGVQSFDDDLLGLMNRRHTSAAAIDAIKMAQSVGFDNITIDLIFGVDGFGEEVLRRSLATALSLGVQHISAYHLTIEEGTLFARRVANGQMRVVDESVSESEYKLIDDELTAFGFEHYEVSNYALPSFRSKHNSSYWQGVHYLGVGAGAHSFNGAARRIVVDSIEQYIAGGEGRYRVEELSDEDHYNEYVMTRLRCAEGVELDELKGRFGVDKFAYFEKNILPWISDGKLRNQSGRVYIPTHHFLVSDLIIESLFIVTE